MPVVVVVVVVVVGGVVVWWLDSTGVCMLTHSNVLNYYARAFQQYFASKNTDILEALFSYREIMG